MHERIHNRPLPQPWLSTFALLLAATLCWARPAAAVDFNVGTEAEYATLKDAVRGAEYVRQRYLEGDANPRALATVVALWAFAERNPLATPEQLAAFVTAYDAGLASMLPGDPMLLSHGSVLTALSGLRLPSDGPLQGMDTRVGPRTLELLGISLPGLYNYEQSRLRMTRFDLASVQRLIQRHETIDALNAMLADVTPGGDRVPGLAQQAASYLTEQGYPPQLGVIDPTAIEINEGLEQMPGYAEFITIRDTPGGHLDLEQEVFSDIDDIQAEGVRLLEAIGTPEVEQGFFLDSLSLSLAAANPDDPGHAAAVAAMEARRAAIIASIRATAAQRAGVFARTLLLQQSSFAEVRGIATTTRSFAALQLQTNNDLAIAQQGTQIVGSLIGIAAGFSGDDPWGAVQSLTDVVTAALGLGALLGDGVPSVEEQIFEQIVALRQQVEDMRVQLNARFDVVDAKLDQVFSTMTAGFAALGNQIGDLQEDVDSLSVAIADARSTLDRIEAALFGFAKAVLLAELSQQTNLALNYYDTNGVGLPYAGGTPSFVASSNYFYTYATTTSKGQPFAGTPDDQPIAVTLDNAAATLGNSAIARRINDLRRVPMGLVAGPPLTPSRVPAPAPWAQGAAAYLQLARENPWYFNHQFATQAGSGGATRIDQIIADGERITGLANAVRDNDTLFDAMLARADEGVELMQDIIIQRMALELPLGFSNGTVQVDPWGTLEQRVSSLLLPVNSVVATSPAGAAGTLSLNTAAFPRRGQEVPVADTRYGFPASLSRTDIAERNALLHLLERGAADRPRLQMYVTRGAITQASGMDAFEIRVGTDDRSAFLTRRTLSLSIEARFAGGNWFPLNFVPFGSPPWHYIHFIERAWPALGNNLVVGNLEEQIYPTGVVFLAPFPPVPYDTRIRVVQDSTIANTTFPQQANYLAEGLATLRQAMRGDLLDQLAVPGSGINQGGLRLDNDAALLDAYLTIGMADAMTRSEMLRSAFRGAPSIGGLGFRSSDLATLVVHEALNDTGAVGGVPGAGLSTIGATLQDRILGLGIEIEQAASSTAPSFPYVEFVLGELREVREQVRNLAIDETYRIDEPGQLVPAALGLMANDIGQPGQINESELRVDLAFFASTDAVPPAHGSISVQEDGAFTYSPFPGFVGTDRFTYRLRAAIPGVTSQLTSAPAYVVIHVGDGLFANGFE